MDLAWNAIDAGAPTAIEVDQDASDKYNPDICPVKLKVSFAHPANAWRGPIQVVWYQGGLKPETPWSYIDIKKIANGALYQGTKGSILADFTSRIVLPNNDDGDFTYYKRRSSDQLLPLVAGRGSPTQQARPARPAARTPQAPPPLPRGFKAWPSAQPGPTGFAVVEFLENGLPADLGLPNTDVEAVLAAEKSGRTRRPDIFQTEWLEACKGKYNGVAHGTSSKTHCDFDYSGTMIEQMLLGLVAHRVGKKLEYDAAASRVTNSAEANDLLKRQYRAGWTLNG